MLDRIKLAGHSFEEILATYESDFFESFLPYLDRRVYDATYGGFMCHMDRNGNQITTNKRTWYDGRGVWVYSYIYRYFGKKGEYLDRAQQTIGFLENMKSENYPFWPWGYSRTGKPLNDHEADIYGALFVAEGFAGYAAATGQEEYWQKSKDILLKCLAMYDSESYQYVPHYSLSVEIMKSPRILGHWMILLNLCGQLLDVKNDLVVQSVSDRCIKTILDHHLHPDFNLLVEYLNHDLSMPDSPIDQFAYTGHGIETLWMIMMEAERRKNESLCQKAVGLFKRHVQVSWDGVYGNFFHELTHVNENRWLTDKVLWAQEEVLTGLMMMMANNQDAAWAFRWFERVYPYVREHFMLRDHPDRLWVNGGDRRMKLHHQVDRFENYHHPRHLMMNIRALHRLTASDRV